MNANSLSTGEASRDRSTDKFWCEYSLHVFGNGRVWKAKMRKTNLVLTMMEEVETTIDPDSVFEDRLIFLWVNWPLAWFRDGFVVHVRSCERAVVSPRI